MPIWDFSEFNDRYRNASGETKSGVVPEGEYTVNVNRVALESSKRGNPLIKWEFSIIGGPYDGRKVFANTCLPYSGCPYADDWTEQLKQIMTACEIAIDDLNDLNAVLGTLTNATLLIKRVRQRNDPENFNTYFKGRLMVDYGDRPPDPEPDWNPDPPSEGLTF